MVCLVRNSIHVLFRSGLRRADVGSNTSEAIREYVMTQSSMRLSLTDDAQLIIDEALRKRRKSKWEPGNDDQQSASSRANRQTSGHNHKSRYGRRILHVP